MPCSLQIVNNGSPKSEGGANEPLANHLGTTIPRLRVIQVGVSRIRRDAGSTSYPGIRSGAEANSPTGDRGCLGNPGWRNRVAPRRR